MFFVCESVLPASVHCTLKRKKNMFNKKPVYTVHRKLYTRTILITLSRSCRASVPKFVENNSHEKSIVERKGRRDWKKANGTTRVFFGPKNDFKSLFEQ